MDKANILSYLPDHPWTPHIQVMEEVESTNTLLKAMGRNGAPEGTVLIADRQTGGRGRLGRTFCSPGGVGIYFSVLLRPNCPPDQLMHLTCAAAVAMCDAVQAASGLRPQVKWINDLVLGTKKLGGILTELNFDSASHCVDFAVIGVGINCLQKKEDFDPSIQDIATSLQIATGNQTDRNLLSAEMIRSMQTLSCQLHTEKNAVMERYKRDCMTIGKDIQVIRSESIRTAHALDIDDAGALIVRYTDDGSIATVSSGEVSVRGMYGYV